MRELRLERVDRGPGTAASLAEPLREAGFRPSYGGWILRPSQGRVGEDRLP